MSLEKIKLIILDVDGTMTDGGVYIDNNRVETKKFSIKDGAGIILAEKVGIEFMILTGRTSNCVEQRAQELKIKYVVQGIHNKVTYLKSFMKENNISSEEIAYIGDDLNDLPSMRIVGTTACPSDACAEVRNYVDFCMNAKGGEGVVREFVEKLLQTTGKWESAIEQVFEQK